MFFIFHSTQLKTTFNLSSYIVVMDERLDTPASSSFHHICAIDMDIELTVEVWPCLSHLFHNGGGPCDQGITRTRATGPKNAI
jgi:hypothetical protein